MKWWKEIYLLNNLKSLIGRRKNLKFKNRLIKKKKYLKFKNRLMDITVGRFMAWKKEEKFQVWDFKLMYPYKGMMIGAKKEIFNIFWDDRKNKKIFQKECVSK